MFERLFCTKTNPHFLALHLIQLELVQSSARSKGVDCGLATSRDILFWTTRGQLLRNNCIIPVTKIAELVEEGTKHVP